MEWMDKQANKRRKEDRATQSMDMAICVCDSLSDVMMCTIRNIKCKTKPG